MKRGNIIVHGLVQGVLFRANTVKAARELGLKGYTKNLQDGTVEVIAEGTEEKINGLIRFLKSSPGASDVSKVDAKFTEPENEFDGFDVKY
jgi:acylphosphatase|tara:strand:+ start:212 stop:484 length:273 start_codon:yes stop_codon:yes gene_type:complete